MLLSLLLLLAPLSTILGSELPSDGQEYVVLYRQSGQADIAAISSRFGIPSADVVANYEFNDEHAGFTAKMTQDKATQLEQDSSIVSVAPNLAIVRAKAIIEQPNPPNYGLGRISHRSAGNFSAYRYDSSAGNGTCIYIVDSGVTAPPGNEFGNRLVQKTNLVPYEDATDINLHGTHVAGIAASLTYGAAKNARVYAVKVLNGTGVGTISWIAQGIAFVMKDAVTETANCPNGFVVNLSLGIDTSLGLNAAQSGALINNATLFLMNNQKPQFNVFIAAGNENKDAKFISPGNTPGACTIGNIDKTDNIYEGAAACGDPSDGASNYGPTVKLWAPGTLILSTSPVNTVPRRDPFVGLLGPFANYTRLEIGTSMSSPLVAGIAATLMAVNPPGFNTTTMCNKLISLATQGAIQNINDPNFLGLLNVNLIAYNGFGG